MPARGGRRGYHRRFRPNPPLGSPGDRHFAHRGIPLDGYDAWLADFRLRLAQHDAGVEALAGDLASRTTWTVRCVRSERFPAPPPAAGLPPDVLCERGGDRPPLCFEVELPETLVRRATVSRLRALVDRAMEPRVVLVGAAAHHARQIASAERLLRRAGLALAVAAIAPGEETITGADW